MSKVGDEVRRRAANRGLMADAARELGFAVDDIRHELVERPWFGEAVTPDIAQELEGMELGLEAEATDPADLYGRDPSGQKLTREIDRDELYGDSHTARDRDGEEPEIER
ncbi:hypothetical protein [Acuticoccus sediminis]|uniref:hypothetical protein n=1 Tax=Acuticoccus sediminis TaxID=2184697 RepID=UPI001CFC5851|nr:hypothetical protein [Acuticoccus sediminis]